MIDEIEGAPLPNGMALDVPVMGIDPTATADAGVVKAKPRRKRAKRKVVAKAARPKIDPLRAEQASAVADEAINAVEEAAPSRPVRDGAVLPLRRRPPRFHSTWHERFVARVRSVLGQRSDAPYDLSHAVALDGPKPRHLTLNAYIALCVLALCVLALAIGAALTIG